MRTQQIVAYESGVASTADPLAGSYYVERLTDELETRAMALIAKSDKLGGSVAAIASGFFQEEIGRSAYEHQLRVESGATTVVGLNRFADTRDVPPIVIPDYSRLERDQVRSIGEVRKRRSAAEVTASLDGLRSAAGAFAGSESEPPKMMPLLIDAVRARCTVGEISSALMEKWGAYSP